MSARGPRGRARMRQLGYLRVEVWLTPAERREIERALFRVRRRRLASFIREAALHVAREGVAPRRRAG